MLSKCSRLCDIVEEAGAILGGVSTVERGASEIRAKYNQMRQNALDEIDEMRRCADD